MKRSFLLTPTATGDLRDILYDLAADSPDAADRLRERFYDGFLTLGRSPGIGHYHDELLSKKYRFWNLYPYVVVYAWEAKHLQNFRRSLVFQVDFTEPKLAEAEGYVRFIRDVSKEPEAAERWFCGHYHDLPGQNNLAII